MAKSKEYWEGFDAETARRASRDSGDFSSLAEQVASALRRDAGRKQKLVARSPGFFSGMDAEEFNRASSRELAVKMLRSLNIEIREDDDPERMIEMLDLGRRSARDANLPGGRLTGGNVIPGNNELKLIGGASATDSREGDSFIAKYLRD